MTKYFYSLGGKDNLNTSVKTYLLYYFYQSIIIIQHLQTISQTAYTSLNSAIVLLA